MNNDNKVFMAARINFDGEPQIQLCEHIAKSKNYKDAFYGNDSWENEYCLNTTAWD